jgi:hypothetical protein
VESGIISLKVGTFYIVCTVPINWALPLWPASLSPSSLLWSLACACYTEYCKKMSKEERREGRWNKCSFLSVFSVETHQCLYVFMKFDLKGQYMPWIQNFSH